MSEQRGKIDNLYYHQHENDEYEYILSQIKNPELNSSEQTTLVKIISKNYFDSFEETLAPILLNIIRAGCPLYTKIEIQNVLSNGKKFTADLLIENLGSIGENQHLKLPSKTSGKKTYPIARDICARILQKMDEIAVYEICTNIQNNKLDNSQISESLDVLGYCIFHNSLLGNEDVLKTIVNQTRSEDSVCKWKAIRALSSFKDNDFVENYLTDLLDKENSDIINSEIERSLKFIR
ncbi:HEAT repeat domain-containing protein [Lactobacillus terrae]|uniref:HEAT repeat domain-containing protein n=1 Tax=Lactobacillus terrae TaxID=2269374 RepID=UPI000C1B7472|nr:HEAT repeat domain-containing protein [Lactobacillus terrae]